MAEDTGAPDEHGGHKEIPTHEPVKQDPTETTVDEPEESTWVHTEELGSNSEDDNGPPSRHKQTSMWVTHPYRATPFVHNTNGIHDRKLQQGVNVRALFNKIKGMQKWEE